MDLQVSDWAPSFEFQEKDGKLIFVPFINRSILYSHVRPVTSCSRSMESIMKIDTPLVVRVSCS